MWTQNAATFDESGMVSSHPTDQGFLSVSVAVEHACALHENKTAVCWGSSADNRQVPNYATDVEMVTTSARASAVVYSNGEAEWFGFRGAAPTGSDFCPGDNCVRADAGRHTICVIKSNGDCKCDGSSPNGLTTAMNA